jgi:hypothetical protein
VIPLFGAGRQGKKRLDRAIAVLHSVITDAVMANATKTEVAVGFADLGNKGVRFGFKAADIKGWNVF